MSIIPIPYSVGGQLSDAMLDKLVNAGLGTLGLIVVIVILVVLGPVLLYLARREAKSNDLLKGLIDQNAETQRDNRRLIEVIAAGQADVKEQNELLRQLNTSNTAIVDAFKARAERDDDTQRDLKEVISLAGALKTDMSEGRKVAIDEVKTHMDENAKTTDERLLALEKEMREIKEMAARILALLEPKTINVELKANSPPMPSAPTETPATDANPE